MKKNPYDVAADSDQFNIGFVSPETFEELKNDENTEFCYSYLLTGNVTAKKLKDHLADMDFDKSMITNRYMLEAAEEAESKNKSWKKDLTGWRMEAEL